jgi:Ca-activated chloride channel family protein
MSHRRLAKHTRARIYALLILLLLILAAAHLAGRSVKAQQPAPPLQPAPEQSAAPPANPDDALPPPGEGALIYRSPISGRYEPVPLVHTDVAIDVRGLVAAATVTQQYANDSEEPVEAVYVFPLPHDAAVYDLEIRIGQRVIRSVIREREEAKRIYEAAKSEGKRAALVEEERPNIFTASVANLMPGDQVDVLLRFVQPLRWEDGRIRLTFPTVVGPRYIPGTQAVGYSGNGWAPDTDAVPDASRITPPVRHPDSRPGHNLSLAVELDAGFTTAGVKCVSHPVHVRALEGGRQRVELASGPTLPNRDFVLELHQANGTEAQTALFLSPSPETGETHFLLAAFPPTTPRNEHRPIEMLYLIDVSGSMAGPSIEQARDALLQALDRLSPADRFGIVAFDSLVHPFAPEPLLATTDNLEAARRFVRGLAAGSGTEMLPALRQLLAFPRSVGHLRHILVLTDGDLGNEEQIFAALRRELGDARLFTVAIGSAPNHFLATKMAQFGRGSFTHIAETGEIGRQIGRLLDRISSPVLTDVTLHFEGVGVTELYPERVPDLFLRQPLVIYGRIVSGKAGRVRFAARAGASGYEANIPFDTAQARFHPGITTLWARQRIDDALDRWRTAEEGERDTIRSAIVADAIRYRLVTRFTSLVAVEEVIANPGGQQRTAAVPSELPLGMQLDKVFGAPATGTADEFLEALGILLLLSSATLLWLLRRAGAPA